jgi:heme-degrading monooxygenase HmoA
MLHAAVDNGVVTQVATVKIDPKNEAKVIKLMIDRVRFMSTQPGFISISLHRSEDRTHILNYVQWETREKLLAAHRASGFRDSWVRLGEVIDVAEPRLYEAILVVDL